jgi:hypothetical protein
MLSKTLSVMIAWVLPFCLCPVIGIAAEPPLLQPVATLALSSGQPANNQNKSWTAVAFSSDNSIVTGLCRMDGKKTGCSLSLVRWQDGTLQRLAQASRSDFAITIHAAGDGQILVLNGSNPSTLYSSDLATTHELPSLWITSSTGKTVVEGRRGSWKLFRLTDSLQPIREGSGYLKSISDDVVVFQDRDVIKVESLDGKQLGSFPLPFSTPYYVSAAPLGKDSLYVDDCKDTGIVNYQGKPKLDLHYTGCGLRETSSSADGKRLMFDTPDNQSGAIRRGLENAVTLGTLGMVGTADINHEDVRVFDTVTGGSCFAWQRSLPRTYFPIKSAAISPSGEFVAIVDRNTLSVYRLPESCGEPAAQSK